MIRPTPRSKLTDTLCPHTTLFRSVAEILFRKEQNLPIRAFHQLMSGNALPVSQRAQRGVMLSSQGNCLLVKVTVKVLAALQDGFVRFPGIGQLLFHGSPWLIPPPRPKILPEIAYGRSEARRVGKECVSTGRSRGAP